MGTSFFLLLFTTFIIQLQLKSAARIRNSSSVREECDPISFSSQLLTFSNGESADIGSPTSITTWSDGKLYIGNRAGQVHVIDYDASSLTITDTCYSEVLTDDRYMDSNGNPSVRTILGITFSPRSKLARPFVTVSTLFWDRQNNIDSSNPTRWFNGGVVRLRSANRKVRRLDPNQCLMFEKTVVSNLPVADGDHSVNDIEFTQDGDLLIAVGSYTNAGLPFFNLGGNWETYFSASVVRAKLSRRGFNGEIEYSDPTNLRTALPISGDVDIFATGVRNMFAMTMARNGRLYATDNGPNCAFGNASSSCNEYDEGDAAERSTDDEVPFPGQVMFATTGDCQFGPTRQDKLLLLREGNFYGHPNIQRALLTRNEDECAYIDPMTDETGPPQSNSAPSSYEPPLVEVTSAMTALTEYGSNLFCGDLRNNLIGSRFRGFGTFRIKLNDDGDEVEGIETLISEGGIAVTENVHGDLIFPQLNPADGNAGDILMLRPDVTRTEDFKAVNALPSRFDRRGRGTLLIGGWGFTENVEVTVSDRSCVVMDVSDTEISCRVPGYRGYPTHADVIVSQDGEESKLEDAVLFMDV